MNELSSEVHAAIIISASQAALDYARIRTEGKKTRKNFNQLYSQAFERHYDCLMKVIVKPEVVGSEV